MTGVNYKMDCQLIEYENILVDAFASCRRCNVIPHSDLLSNIELCSSYASNQRCINIHRYLGLHLYADGENGCHACVRSQLNLVLEYKSLFTNPLEIPSKNI